ncbi:class I SAM-dependent methyltransferase [Actinomadura rudentiformis]|uniref:Class I SAM-dependent methyltransferase n=1 Tax=Actinomadura rudentiformis TaxID=359158 RepID=A0A6H9YKP4_9ACTN|nr:class I SAM-dependent methyltransferase [Actinomadura rudentiformis]KAB2346158.1 class I SAM-dependent methyltransferase [Actinomadura rudentiformis]
MSNCRVCRAPVHEFFDFGRHPLSQAFITPEQVGDEFFYRLAIGACESCGMVQLLEEIPPEQLFHKGYPYHSSNSTVMRAHFEETARRFLADRLTGPDPFMVEIGCNDGVTLQTVRDAGVRHLAFEPTGVGGVRTHGAFFDAESAAEVRASDGPADVIYAANTICDIPDIGAVIAGADALLSPQGVLVFEDPYFGEIIGRTSFDQIYDEHFYFFTVGSVRSMARHFGFELLDAEWLPVHGGQIRYTLGRAGSAPVTPAVARLLAAEENDRLTDPSTLAAFADRVTRIRTDLRELLERLAADGKRVAGYGATAKSSTVTNYCGIGPDLVPFVCDTTPSKHGKVTPGAHIPVRPPAAFSDDYPDYALLFAWNHAEEIMAKEEAFRAAGGKWIIYVPEVHIV